MKFYEGYFKDTIENGKGKLFHLNSTIEEGNWLDGQFKPVEIPKVSYSDASCQTEKEEEKIE